jgi:hypothetical protein
MASNKPFGVRCIACARETQHETAASKSNSDESGSWWVEAQIIRCRGCGTLSFRMIYDDGDERLYPPRVRWGRTRLRYQTSLPKAVRILYGETYTALTSFPGADSWTPQQPVLAAVGIRAMVEAVARHKRARGKNLKERIDDLASKGVITEADARILHRTRFLGNKAAHEAAPAAPEVLDAASRVVEHMLTSVYLLKRVAARLPRRGR